MTQRVCKWCDRSMEPKGAPLDPAAPVTHGMCWPCAVIEHAKDHLPEPKWIAPPDGYPTWAHWRGEAPAWPPVVAGGQGRDADEMRHNALGMWLCAAVVVGTLIAWWIVS